VNNHEFATSEHGRRLSNMILVGTVNQLDVDNAVVTVDADDLTTDWIPWLARRAGPDSDWWAPEPGEQVVIACPYGDASQGFVIGSVYQNAYPAPANAATVWRKQFADGTFITYDRAAHALTVDASSSGGSVTVNCATADVKASESVTLDTPKTHCTGDLIVDGNTELNGNTDVKGSTTVKAITSNGTDISSAHYHGNGNGGQPTTPPIG